MASCALILEGLHQAQNSWVVITFSPYFVRILPLLFERESFSWAACWIMFFSLDFGGHTQWTPCFLLPAPMGPLDPTVVFRFSQGCFTCFLLQPRPEWPSVWSHSRLHRPFLSGLHAGNFIVCVSVRSCFLVMYSLLLNFSTEFLISFIIVSGFRISTFPNSFWVFANTLNLVFYLFDFINHSPFKVCIWNCRTLASASPGWLVLTLLFRLLCSVTFD